MRRDAPIMMRRMRKRKTPSRTANSTTKAAKVEKPLFGDKRTQGIDGVLEHQRRNRGRQIGHGHTHDAERELNPVLLRASDQARQFGESIHRTKSQNTATELQYSKLAGDSEN